MLLELKQNTTRVIQHVLKAAQAVKTGQVSSLVQMSSVHRRHHHEKTMRTIRKGNHHHKIRHHHETHSPSVTALAVHKIMNHINAISTPDEIPVSDKPMDEEMQEENCTINNNPNCEKFIDSMMTIVGETSCKMTDMEKAVSEAQDKCEAIKDDYNNQIEDLQGRAYDASVDMANGIKDKGAAELMSKQKKDELDNIHNDF